MRFNHLKVLGCATLFSLLFAFGCTGGKTPKTKPVADINASDATIGMFADVIASDAIPVRGYALVGGLNGTGSSQCPADIRAYLEKYILQHLSGSKVNVNALISSPDTAVVIVDGIIPPAASKKQQFDVRVVALPGTQTTSLEGGWLYGADLYDARQLGTGAKPLAEAKGPVYIDSVGSEPADNKFGYVLGGGSVSEDYRINLALRRPDYRIASQIRNRINERFGYEIAWAMAPGSIELRVPSKYTNSKDKFIRLVRATYLVDTPELTEKRIIDHIKILAAAPDKNASEIALEAIGNASLPKLADLLNSSGQEVQFRAARCMLNLGDQRGREALWNIATDKSSPARIEAIEAIVSGSTSDNAASMLRGLLHDTDFNVRLTAYQNLARLNDVAVSRKLIADGFYLDQIALSGEPAIFVSRRDQACVALFGAPIYCRSNLFVQTPGGAITINAPQGDKSVTIIRKHPRRSDVIVTLKSSFDLADIIQTLCREPLTPLEQGGPGLGVSYSTLVELLKQMVDSGAVNAQFHVGPPPKNLSIIKK